MFYFGSVTKDTGKVITTHWRESSLVKRQNIEIQEQRQVVIERDEEERRPVSSPPV
jgi:hypothetical protein